MANKTGLVGFAHHLVTKDLLEQSYAEDLLKQAQAKKTSFTQFLIHENILAPEKLAPEVMVYFGIPLFYLDAYDKNTFPKEFIQLPLMQNHLAVPIKKTKDKLYLAVSDPLIPNLNEVKLSTKLDPVLVLVEEDKLIKLIDNLMSKQFIAGLGNLEDASLDEVNISAYKEEAPEATLADVNETPIVRYVNKILIDAINGQASDIHFEPYEGQYRIRYRRDGVLHKIANPPFKFATYLVARIKIMANLDISERRVPQDGRFKLSISKHKTMDFRVSTCPTLYGEKVVMRLLDTSQGLPSIDSLGMDAVQKKNFEDALMHSQGMILVCGPTGSGKTVTLYTGINILNTEDVNISTVEDPVEIPVPGVNQVHINVKAGMTFATALRSFLRQDPDIIMVGEIRDLETAEIAVKAAQTGHLVLSTVHTNSAPETVQRLANMGVAPFNIASSLILVIAQRLVRILCSHCKKEVSYPEEVLLKEGFNPDEISKLTLFGPGGCDKCDKGYRGRLGIFQVMPITEAMAALIMKGGNAIQIAELASKEGVIPMRDSGLNRVREGITSLEELNNIIKG